MDEIVHHASAAPEALIDEGCFIAEWWNSDRDPDLSVARARVPPGVTTRWHLLDGTAERYLVLEGEGRVELGDDAAAPVGPLDVVLIPPGLRQRITNTGQADLVFLALCTPRFDADAYHEVEGPVPAP